MKRMIDANINRICEGLRVIEDFLRFEMNDEEYIDQLKKIRHYIRERIGEKHSKENLPFRDSANDKGKKNSETENKRDSYTDLIKANFYRVEEGLRVLEECFKLTKEIDTIKKVKSYRFEIYDIEKKVILILKKRFPDK